MTVPNVHPATSTRRLLGLPAAPGRNAGPALRWGVAAASSAPRADQHQLDAAFREADRRLREALATADGPLRPLLEAQRLMLDDPELRDGIAAQLAAGDDPITAVSTVIWRLAEALDAAGSAYFRDRAIDIRAIGKLLLEAFSDTAPREVPAGAVILAEELAPLDTARFADAGVAALVTVHGGPTCHAAILARAWGIPAVVGAPREILEIPEGMAVLVDGTRGEVIISPAPEELVVPADEAPMVAIARRIPLFANAGSQAEVERAVALGAEGIGLLRTEFLFQDRVTAPDEEEQTAIYRQILTTLDGRSATMRTLDIGADKPVSFLPLPAEPNPQLGLRGIRLCLTQRDLFRTQLRALLRASEAGPLRIMLPMVTTVEEVMATRALLAEEAAALGVPPAPLGIMIEVPMAALAADALAAVSDFFSLGTNDLLQFLLAADRQLASVGYLHAQAHPAMWTLLAGVIDAAHRAGIPAGVCGEWGADATTLARLVELGIDTTSVAVGALARVRGYLG